MAIARLNFSHGAPGEHQLRIDAIRGLNKKYGYNIKILQDLEGYRVRIGRLAGNRPVFLRKGENLFLANGGLAGRKNTVPFDYGGPLKEIKRGSPIYIDDGNIMLVVKESARDYLKTEVVIPGLLKENKGINIPEAALSFKGLTDKDKMDLDFGMANRVDFIAQSFVRGKNDILELRDYIKSGPFGHKIIAKIENRQGLENIDEIIEVADGIIVARGDLGVSVPVYEIPILQKIIIRKCNLKGKFVITATQMLESMTEHQRPTRAEASDVANAVLDGSDYLMLSAETAVGKYPVESVRMMRDIIRFTSGFLKKGKKEPFGLSLTTMHKKE
jgi:pyruvate kinase